MTTFITQTGMEKIPAEEISDRDRLPHDPMVSVVMMTRNHVGFVQQAVESVVTQECIFKIELLIGEDYSTDGTRDRCEQLQKKYPNLIRLIVAHENVGITSNFLRLACRAKGKYIAFLEGDDYWTHNGKLQKQVALMNAHGDYSWCGTKTSNRTFCVKEKTFYTLEDTLRRYIFHTSSILFRAEIVRMYPCFPDEVCWDSMLTAYLSDHGNCGFVDEEMSYYRRHEGGLCWAETKKKRMYMTWVCVDAINKYFNNRYARLLCKRELWLYEMDTAIRLGSGFWLRWIQSISLSIIVAKRIMKNHPFHYIRFFASVIFQPVFAIFQIIRMKLAVKNRFNNLRMFVVRKKKHRNG